MKNVLSPMKYFVKLVSCFHESSAKKCGWAKFFTLANEDITSIWIKVLEQEIDFLKKETKKYKPKKKDEKQEMTDLEKEELWLNEEIPEYNGCIKALLLLIF